MRPTSCSQSNLAKLQNAAVVHNPNKIMGLNTKNIYYIVAIDIENIESKQQTTINSKMAATVKPFSSAATFTFKKPVPTEKPLTGFSEQFLTRLKDDFHVNHPLQIFTIRY